uniref:Uncharacterized protein n=1 Tax=Anguilla anguilla TaxID=7936 RepID=A0A0E9VR33_ANGAN
MKANMTSSRSCSAVHDDSSAVYENLNIKDPKPAGSSNTRR